MDIVILKIGDLIEWSFPKDHGSFLAAKTFQSKIVDVFEDSYCYGVYAEYGVDYVPFDRAKLVKN
jgi:hypothetical protein